MVDTERSLEGVVMKKKYSPNINFWSNKRVLVTGHTGFKGSWLSLWLSELGAEVIGVGLDPEPGESLFLQLGLKDQISKHGIIDIRDYDKLSNFVQDCSPDIVFHLAAQPLVRRSYKDPLGTWGTNVQGSLNLLESLKATENLCSVVMVTTDKVYENNEWDYGYRENDRLGGHDPYSASKAAAELAISSWRSSFCGNSSYQNKNIAISTARAGNVIGGGDWAEDRIIPDAIRSLASNSPIRVRNPLATRPWQHVLEPLSGYLRLAEKMFESSHSRLGQNKYTSSYNFGPSVDANKTVKELLDESLLHWPGTWVDLSSPEEPHEARRLHLQIDKAFHHLEWEPKWDFPTTVQRTITWYKQVTDDLHEVRACCLADIEAFTADSLS